MTKDRYEKIQYVIRRLSVHVENCDELNDEETTQRQNFGAHMEEETAICKDNEKCLMEAMTHIQSAIDELKQIDP
jgi:hypothetical protein